MSKSQANVKSEIRKELLTDFQDKEYAHGYIDEFLNTEIATQIRVLREQQELTQKELAELAGMKQSRISLLEDVYYGSWSIKTLKKLSEALDVTLKVSFETFTDRINDILNLSRESLQRTPRELDLATYIDTSRLDILSETLQVSPEEWRELSEQYTEISLIDDLMSDVRRELNEKEEFVSFDIEPSGVDPTIEYKNAA